ncbi:MAG: hypothetical protein ABSG95_14820 [Solirubrobacteraceae bacterium]|jgi:hypothetical protein
MIDLTRVTLRIGAIYNDAAGLGGIVMDPRLAEAHAVNTLDDAIYVTGGVRRAQPRPREHPPGRRHTAPVPRDCHARIHDHREERDPDDQGAGREANHRASETRTRLRHRS